MRQLIYQIRINIGRFFFALLVILIIVPANASQQDSAQHSEDLVKPYVDADAYSIYAILLGSNKRSFVVIQSETVSWAKATPKNVGIKGNRNFYKVWGAVLKDYAKQYRNSRLLMRDIPTEVSYELVSKQRIDNIFNSEKKWEAFYEHYPSSDGYFSFSAVGFDPQKTHAIVDMDHSCGGLCGGGGPHFFEKKNGKWREVAVDAEVMYWAS